MTHATPRPPNQSLGGRNTPNPQDWRLCPNWFVVCNNKYYCEQHLALVCANWLNSRVWETLHQTACWLVLVTDAYPTNEVVFHWRWDAEPVEVTRAKVSGYSITNITSSGCTSSIEGNCSNLFRPLSCNLGMHACMHACIYVWMYVCIYIKIHIAN